MKLNVKKLLSTVMAVSMTASLVVIPNVHAEETPAATLPGTHVAVLFDGQNNPWHYDAEEISNFYGDIYKATDNTRINYTENFTNFQDADIKKLSDENALDPYIKSYFSMSPANGAQGRFFTDEKYLYGLNINPYKSLAGANERTDKIISDNLMVGMTSNIYYNTSDKWGRSYFDFSSKVNGGYFTMEYNLRRNESASEEINKEFFDNLYVLCWDAQYGHEWWYKTEESNGNTPDMRGNQNYVAVKLSDFDSLSYNDWHAVKIPMSAFSEIQKDKYNYNVKTMINNGAQAERGIDFKYFGGIGLVWIAPNDTTAYKEDTDYNKVFNVLIGNISMEQVLAPTIAKTEQGGQVTINWDAVNADTSFNSKVWSDETYTSTDTANTYRESQRSQGTYYKLLSDDNLTENITYSVYKNGKEVQNSAALSYTDKISSRNATYYVVAHGQKLYDQRRGWNELDALTSIKTLQLDSVKSNEVETGAGLDPEKNTKVLDLFVNGNLIAWQGYDYYALITDRDTATGEFNEKYNLTATPKDFANYYMGGLLDYANVYGKSYNLDNCPTERSGKDKEVVLKIEPSRFNKSTLESNLTNEEYKISAEKLFNDNLHGVQMSLVNTTKDEFNHQAAFDFSEMADTAALAFEMKYSGNNAYADSNKDNILNHLYVMVSDGKDSQVYFNNGGQVYKTSNYVLVKLSDFIDVSKVIKDNWVTVNVPLSAFKNINDGYNRKIYTMSTDLNNLGTTTSRPIDFKYFTGAGLVYVADGTETNGDKDAADYGIHLDNMAIYNVKAPVVNATYDAGANATNVTWDMANEGYVTYDVYKNGNRIAEDVENGTYTDTEPNVDAVYTVKANNVIDYLKANKYSTSESKQTLTNVSDGAKIEYATVDFDTANGVKAIGKFNPGATGVWIVIKFDKNYSVVGDIHTEDISKLSEQQVKEYNTGTLGEGETVKSFLWSDLTNILPKIDAEVYPAK